MKRATRIAALFLFVLSCENTRQDERTAPKSKDELVVASFDSVVAAFIANDDYSLTEDTVRYLKTAEYESPELYTNPETQMSELRLVMRTIPAGWVHYRSWLSSPAIDVQTTQSLVSPYVGTLRFTRFSTASDHHASESGADLDSTGGGYKYAFEHLLTYAYQGDGWVFKSHEYRSQHDDGSYSEWKDYVELLRQHSESNK